MSQETRFNFDFLGKRLLAYIFSLTLIIGTIVIWVQKGETKYGTDFKGGNLYVVQLGASGDEHSIPSGEDLSNSLQKGGVDGATVQAFESKSRQFSVRVGPGMDSQKLKGLIESALKKDFGNDSTVLSSDFIGATIGGELKTKALIAIACGLLGILAYVSFRFEFAFALGAVVALFHDVIVAAGAYLLAGHELNMASVASALTIVGYSVNDTIVIFDRVREELLKDRKYDLEKVLNYCMNAMLGRTIITSMLTFFSTLALFLFGGGAISDLSVFLLAGIIAGSYSTIFIASPIVLAWERMKGRDRIKAA